ncbi:MAG: InlB B-repeat-containing protein [Candidatus Aenigmatarchaeota archaeon]
MKSGKVGKMATALAVLLLVLSGVVVVQWNAQPVEATESDNQTHKYTIEGFIDAGISIESDLELKLRDLKTGEVEEKQTSEDFYEFTDINAGWYEIIFPSQLKDGTAYMKKVTEPIRVDDNKIKDLEIDAEKTDMTLEGYIFDEDEEPIENAVVTVEDQQRGFVHSVQTETITVENETLSKYEMEIYGDFEGRFKVEKEGYAPHVDPSFSIEEPEEPTYYDLSTASTSGGDVIAPGEGTFEYEEGDTVDLEAAAEDGYEFVEWTGDNETVEDTTANQTTITMNGNHTITAEFESVVQEYTLSIDSTEGGEVIAPGEGTFSYEEGTSVNLEAVADPDYEFVEWTGDNETIDNTTANQTTIEMQDDYTVNAEFVNVSGSLVGQEVKSDGVYTHNATLFTEPVVEGRLVDQDGRGIREEMDITLYNDEIGMLQRTKEGPTFRIRAPANYDYTLVIDARGYEPLVKEVISLEGNEKLGRQSVNESESENFETNLEFDGVNSLTIENTRNLNSGTRMKTLDHSSVGYLPMQIDMALGNQDLQIDDEEIGLFEDRLVYSEADIPTTSDLIKVNDTLYELEDYSVEFEGMDKLKEDFIDPFEGDIVVNAVREYEAVEDLEEGPYAVDLEVDHPDTYGNRRIFNYTLDVMEGYERYDETRENSIEFIPETVEVDGYTQLTIDPQSDEESETSNLVLDLREYDEGEVDILIEREPWVFEKADNHYVIKKDTEAVLNSEYQNPISKALNFTWKLDDEIIGYDEEMAQAFNDTGEMTLELEVEESNGRIISDDAAVVVDDEGPQGTIKVRGEEIVESTTADEGEELNFSAENFEDTATGNISSYQWNFSDDSEPMIGANLTHLNHTFDIPGSYNVTLNVTDPVGNWNEEMIEIEVNDTTKPSVVIRTEWDGESSYDSVVEHDDLTIGTNVTLNASESTAHPDYEGELTSFEWWIEELEMKAEGETLENVSFDDAGDYEVWVNVTDESGNYRNQSVTVHIRRGPTPDLMVHTELRFSKDTIKEGDSVTISVNVTNQGDANATQIDTVLRVDGDLVDVDAELYKDDEELNRTHIEPNEEIEIKIKWTPESDGEKTVNVNVTDNEEAQHSELLWNNDVEDTVDVEPPEWREYLVYALIPIIIIGVTVGLYFYKDKIKEKLGK